MGIQLLKKLKAKLFSTFVRSYSFKSSALYEMHKRYKMLYYHQWKNTDACYNGGRQWRSIFRYEFLEQLQQRPKTRRIRVNMSKYMRPTSIDSARDSRSKAILNELNDGEICGKVTDVCIDIDCFQMKSCGFSTSQFRLQILQW